MIYERIYLIGMPGSGKSTEGKFLAKKLQWQFIDLDAAIEVSTQKTIAELFKEQGELFFRETEQKELNKTFFQSKIIVACGGGTVAFENNMDLINKYGLSIYLKANPIFLQHRISASKSSRPMFIGLNAEEIHIKLKEILMQRYVYYEMAKMSIDIPSERGIYLLNSVLNVLKYN